MKTIFFRILIITMLAAKCFANSVTNDAFQAQLSKVSSVAVLFTKQGRTESWADKKLSEILPVSQIAKIVLLKGETSAPGQVDIINIYRELNEDNVFYKHDVHKLGMHTTYEAVIVMKDQRLFLFQSGYGEVGHGEARLTSEKGDYGYFRRAISSQSTNSPHSSSAANSKQ